ncbi:MAG: ATP-binding cassette domain-containing protein, partial [Robiginitalea sp.]|nr:ATP-binding cassette domain-containing protein [Robiginitalea sp.]
SNTTIEVFLEEEARHDRSGLSLEEGRRLATYSSGERKKALLASLLTSPPEFLILDNPFDNLDRQYQEELRKDLAGLGQSVILIQFLSRVDDLLPGIERTAFLSKSVLKGYPEYTPRERSQNAPHPFPNPLPPAPDTEGTSPEILVDFREVALAYEGRPILDGVAWRIKQGDFWELRGPNGSGKTSLITMITGDNPKVYGQPVYLFGNRRGSGESIWEIKERIGYFTPAMTDRFRGYHKTLHMLISGFTDSVGLYVRPTDRQVQLGRAWLELLGMEDLAEVVFQELTEGQKRLLMCARAMIKHPPLLILDEPTAGLDEASAHLLVSLVRKMARESRTAIVFVSHREEPGLKADFILELLPGANGSTAVVHTANSGS